MRLIERVCVCLQCMRHSHRFLEEFLEVGGVLTVVEILSVKQAKDSDKTEALKLLACVASAGRQYKEIICEGYGWSEISVFAAVSVKCVSVQTTDEYDSLHIDGNRPIV